ncbi:MAG: hypothetical protein LBJ92_01975 [Holosporales bacterium]|nr:hypothetical protein [Holosporales bacterium]
MPVVTIVDTDSQFLIPGSLPPGDISSRNIVFWHSIFDLPSPIIVLNPNINAAYLRN